MSKGKNLNDIKTACLETISPCSVLLVAYRVHTLIINHKLNTKRKELVYMTLYGTCPNPNKNQFGNNIRSNLINRQENSKK